MTHRAGQGERQIHKTEIDSTDWAEAHWKSIAQNGWKAPHFEEIANSIEAPCCSQLLLQLNGYEIQGQGHSRSCKNPAYIVEQS